MMSEMSELLKTLSLNARKVEVLPPGYHTRVTLILHDNGDHSVVKVIRKITFTDPAVASELAGDIRTYHALLARSGIRLPEIGKIELLPSSTTGNDLVLIVPFEGYDAERKLLSGELSADAVVDGVLAALDPLLTKHVCCQLKLGVDPKPANFVSHNGNHFSYIDWMPPRFWKGGVALVEYEPPKSAAGFSLAFFRSYDVRGILLVLQSQLSKLIPASRLQIKGRIMDYASSLGGSVADYLQQRPSEQVFHCSPDQSVEIVGKLEPQDMYELREIACELVRRRRADEEFLKTVFHRTHFYNDLPDGGLFGKAQQLVKSFLR